MFSEIYHKEAFHGAGQLLQLEIAPGTQLSRFRARFLEPDIFRTHLKPISLDLDLFKRLRIYETHDEDRFEQRIRFGRKFTHDLWERRVREHGHRGRQRRPGHHEPVPAARSPGRRRSRR